MIGTLVSYQPERMLLVLVTVVLLVWVLVPFVLSLKRWGFLWPHGIAFSSRILASVILALALFQVSSLSNEFFQKESHRFGLIVDASQSFHLPEVVRRIRWLEENTKFEACLFGGHEENPSSSESLSSRLGTHRTSRTESLNQCVKSLEGRGLRPDQMIVYTDSRLNWTSPVLSKGLHWVHEEGHREKVDLAVHGLLNQQLFFKGTDNHTSVEVLARGVRGAVPLGIYGPKGLIRTVNVDPTDDWKAIQISFSEQDAIGLEKGMPLLFRFPRLSEETNPDNNETVLFPLWADHKVKVLHVSGSPSTDTYYMRRWLKSQVNYDVISFYILKDFNDDNSVPQQEISLIPFPTDKLFGTELNKFDVVILQNFEWSSFLQGQLIQRLKTFLQSPGKGLFLVGGPRAFKGRDLSNQDLRTLLPFSDANRSWSIQPSYQDLPKKGVWTWAKSFPMRDRMGPALRLENYPHFDALNDLQLSPQAEPWGGLLFPGVSQPRWVLGSLQLGEGRVLMMITDQLFRWIIEASDLDLGDLYGIFMENALSWLSYSERDADDRIFWPPSQFLGESYAIRYGGSVQLECDGKTQTVFEKTWQASGPGFCRVIKPRAEWIYQLDVYEERTLRAPSLEDLQKKIPEAALLTRLSEVQWRDLIRRVQGQTDQSLKNITPIWSHPWLIIILCGSLLLDWRMRRKAGLR